MKKMKGLIVPADLYLELVRIYKEQPPEKVSRKLWIEAHRLECVAQRKFFESRPPKLEKQNEV